MDLLNFDYFEHWDINGLMTLVACGAVMIGFCWWYDIGLRVSIWFQRDVLRRKDVTYKLPPGHLGLPLVGETPFILMSRPSNNDKMGTYLLQKHYKYGGGGVGKEEKEGLCLLSMPPLGCKLVFLSSPKAIEWCLSKEGRGFVAAWDDSSRALIGSKGVSMVTGKTAHKRIRSATLSIFQPSNLRQYSIILNRVIQKHFQDNFVMNTGTTNNNTSSEKFKKIIVKDEIQSVLFKIMADMLIGIDLEKDAGTVQRLESLIQVWATGLFMPTVWFPGNPFVAAMKAREEIRSILDTVIQERRRRQQQGQQPGDGNDGERAKISNPGGILDALLFTTDLTDDEIFDNLLTLLFAGTDTAKCTMTWMIRKLCQYPQILQNMREEHSAVQQQRRARQQGKAETNGVEEQEDFLTLDESDSLFYTQQVLCESMRMVSPANFSLRVATQDMIYEDYIIPKGYKVLIGFHALHHSTNFQQFCDPTTFEPSRFQEFQKRDSPSSVLSLCKTFKPFGAGARMCIGYRLALLEMNIMLHHLVLNYDFKLDEERFT